MEKDDIRLADKGSSHSELDEKGDVLADIDAIGTEIQAIPEDVLEAAEYAKTMKPEAIEETIQRIADEHGDDPNFPTPVLTAARRYLYNDELKQNQAEYQRVYEELKVEAAMIVINSPYAEVRAVVDNHDDLSISANTFRTWVIGTIFVGAGGFINQFFSIRVPSIYIYSNVAQVLAYPFAKLLEATLPQRSFTTFGWTWSLNPGPFNAKEHMLITIMANVGFHTPYTTQIVWVQYLPLYFNQSWATGFGYQILGELLVALGPIEINYVMCRFSGYGLAGITRRFLVYPAARIWPTNLGIIALNRAFHAEKQTTANGWSMSRMRWFLYCFCSMFVYFWFPDFIFQSLSYFNWMTWIAPDNVHLAAITGSISGLGLNPLPTFDWNQFVVFVDPLIFPFFSTFNTFLGSLVTLPIIVALWYTNTWYTGYLPINSNRVFDNSGKVYNVSNAVGSNTLFDQTKFENYSPAYLSAGILMIYGVYFALYTATVTHTFLYHRHEIAHGFRSLFSRKKTSEVHPDVHVRLMMSYKEVPEWQYLMILVMAIAIGAAGIGAYPTQTSPAVVLYGGELIMLVLLFVASQAAKVFLAAIFLVPIGIILSITNVTLTLNAAFGFQARISWSGFSLSLTLSLFLPGNAVAMNYFKAYGYVTTSHTLTFAQDLKLAHYMHIPPVLTFWAQIWATIVSSFLSINSFFTASVLWGTLGPKRMFGAGGIYNGLLYCFPIGLILPIPVFMLRKRFKVLEYFHLPVFLTGGLTWTPYSMANVWPAVPVAYVFNVLIKRRYIQWWSKYNYITTTAFSSAIAICAVVIFFAVQWPGVTIDWIGNKQPFQGCDSKACRRLPIPTQGWFGPACSQETLNATTGFQLRPLKTLIRFYQRSQLTVEFVHQKQWWKAAPSTVEAISFDVAIEKIRAAHSDPNRVLRERLGVTLVIKLLNDRLELSFTATINPINSLTLIIVVKFWLHSKKLADIPISYEDLKSSVVSTNSPDTPYGWPLSLLVVTSHDLRSVVQEAMAISRNKADILERLHISRDLLNRMLSVSLAISEVHPTAKVLVGCCTEIYKELVDRREYDLLVADLAVDILDAMDCVIDIRYFVNASRSNSLEQAFSSLQGLAVEASNMIVKYNSGAGQISQRKLQIETLRKEFRHFMDRFQLRLPLLTATELRQKMDDFMCMRYRGWLLDKVPHGEDTRRLRRCMSGFSQIKSWEMDLNAPNILWLTGYPGTSVSWSLVYHSSRPYFFFRRDNTAYSTSRCLWFTIAADMAGQYPPFGKAAVEKLEKGRIGNPAEIFLSLIPNPFDKLPDNPGVVVVVDAINECGGLDGDPEGEVTDLLATLAQWATLPPVSSSSQQNIADKLRPI
ncbi:OPT oligopeptide transporter protein-domain-containing protein [Mycena rebaudengoi]|nr:OPT oligopeptide transporter protein-domain-containing protein [Mycena rebaudengoi]